MLRIQRKLWLITALCFLAVVLGFAGWIGWRIIDTSGMACDPRTPVDAMRLALWNPFRDRAPEAAATLVMKARTSGECQAISPAQTYCARKEPIAGWRVTGASKDKDGAVVRVWVDAQKHDSNYGDNALYISLKKQGQYWTVLRSDWSDACGY